LKDPPLKPLAEEHVKYIFPLTSCWPPCPFTRPTDQHHRVLWTQGFSAVTRLLCSSLSFALNFSCSSALPAYFPSNTLTFPLPSCTQSPPSTTTASKTQTPTPRSSAAPPPWGGQPLEHTSSARIPATVPASLPPASAAKASSSHATSYQGVFFSLPPPLHATLCLQPHLPPVLGTCTCDGTVYRITDHGIIGWKRPLTPSRPTIHPTPPCLLNHVLQCHIHTVFEPLQGWGLPHCPGQPGPTPDHSFSE